MVSSETLTTPAVKVTFKTVEGIHLLNPWSSINNWRNGLISQRFPTSLASSEAEYLSLHPDAAGLPVMSISVSPTTLLALSKCEPMPMQQDVARVVDMFDIVTIKFGGPTKKLAVVLDVHMPVVRQALLQWHRAGKIPCFFRTVDGSHIAFTPPLQTPIPRFIERADRTPVPPLAQRMNFVARLVTTGELAMLIPPECTPIAICAPEDLFEVMQSLPTDNDQAAQAGVSQN